MRSPFNELLEERPQCPCFFADETQPSLIQFKHTLSQFPSVSTLVLHVSCWPVLPSSFSRASCCWSTRGTGPSCLHWPRGAGVSAKDGCGRRTSSLLLLACRAANTVVFLDCCFASGVFSRRRYSPGLAVLPAQSATRIELYSGFSRKVLIPVLRGKKRRLCREPKCQAFHQDCSSCSGKVPLKPLLMHLKYHLQIELPMMTHWTSHMCEMTLFPSAHGNP
jgi:hypothetical protein